MNEFDYFYHKARPEQDMSTTFEELLSSLGDYTCQNSEFFTLNAMQVISIWPLNEENMKTYWECMNIYDAYGLNYFPNYVEFIAGYRELAVIGIEAWFTKSRSTYDQRESSIEALKHFVKLMRFFGVTQYGEVTIEECETALENSPCLIQKKKDNDQEEYEKKAKRTIENKVKSYFNFGDFDENCFKQLVERFTTKRRKQAISIDEALRMTNEDTQKTYLVLFSKNGKICAVGKTENPLFYIGQKSKKCEADSVIFDEVEKEYANDVLFAVKIYFDLPLRILHTQGAQSRKYATLKHACYAYRQENGIKKSIIIQAIEKGKLRTFLDETGETIIDKISLEKQLLGNGQREK